MTHHVLTRAELNAMIWKEPMRTVAGRLGISDVGLAKACRHHEAPVLERGHWAKLAAGKKVVQPPLPDRPDGSDRIVVAPAAPRRRPTPQSEDNRKSPVAITRPPWRGLNQLDIA